MKILKNNLLHNGTIDLRLTLEEIKEIYKIFDIVYTYEYYVLEDAALKIFEEFCALDCPTEEIENDEI